MSGVEIVQAFFQPWAPNYILDAVNSLSFLTHFNGIIRGVIDFRDVVYFASIIGVFLYVNAIIIIVKYIDYQKIMIALMIIKLVQKKLSFQPLQSLQT